MTAPLSSSAKRVQRALAERGVACRVLEMPASTRTAAEAAAAIGCEVAQIAKSLVFRGASSGDPVLVVASGGNRVDEDKVANLLGEPVARADADYVRARTGFAIGGVPPVGHAETIRTVLDEDLFAYDVVWAAAGTPRAVFETSADQLAAMSNALVATVKPSR